jgi:hypothetical protein
MKIYYFISIILLVFIVQTSFEQGKEDTNYRLWKIRGVYDETNAFSNYDVVTIDDPAKFLEGPGNPDNGGQLKGFFKADTLKKITEWIGLSHLARQNEYYYNNGELVFAFATESRFKYDSLNGFDLSKPYIVFWGRFYFNNKKLIYHIIDNKEHSTVIHHEDGNSLIAASIKYAQLLKKEKNNFSK